MESVLIVDDEPNIRAMAELILKRAGIPARSVADGRAALAAAETAWPGVVLLDLTLAGAEDGWQVWEALAAAAQGRPLKVILFGSALDSADRLEAERRGAAGILLKTVAPRRLITAIQQALGKNSDD